MARAHPALSKAATRNATASALAGAAGILMSAFLLSRLSGLARTMAISYQFGTGPDLEAYLVAIRIPEFLFQVVAGGAVSSAFVPVLSAYLAKGDESGAWRTVSALLSLSIAVMTPICLIIGIFAPEIVAMLVPEFDPERQRLTSELARILLISPVLFALGTFATSVLNTRRRFFLAALAPTTYNLGIIGGALLLGQHLGIHGLAIGAATGSAFFLLIQIPGLIQCGLRYSPRLGLTDPGVRRVATLMAPRTLGLAVTQVNFVVIVALAAPFPGAITALDYAWTLMMLPLGLFAMAISTAVFPTLADQAARSQFGELTATLSSSLRVILYLTVPATAGLIILATPIVRLILERGEFDASSTALTVHALRFYAIGLLGQATIEIVTRAFYALHDTRTPVAVAALSMLLNVALALSLRPILGFGGLALSLSTVSLIEAAALLALARRRFGTLDGHRIALSFARDAVGAICLTGAALATLAAIRSSIPGDDLFARLVVALVPILTGGAVYAFVTLALRSEEPMRVLALARRRLG